MYYLVYTSEARRSMSEKDLEQLLIQSQRNNTKYGVTGLLLYSDMKFIQVIEGEKQDILNLYDNIKLDIRHNNVSVLVQGNIKKRRYPEWSMYYKTMMPEEVLVRIGFRDPHKYFEENPITDESHVYEIFMKLFFDNLFTKEQQAGMV